MVALTVDSGSRFQSTVVRVKKEFLCWSVLVGGTLNALVLSVWCLATGFVVTKSFRTGARMGRLLLRTGKQRSVWVHETLKMRVDHGEHHQLVQELLLHDGHLQAYFRMTQGQFDNLLSIIRPYNSGYPATSTSIVY